MPTTINADTVTGGAVVTGDASGQLALQAAGNTALTINSSRAIGFGASPSYGTAGQVLTSNGSTGAPTWTNISGVLVTPTLSGVTSANMLTTITITISNYNPGYAYIIAVTAGTYTQSTSTISWTLPSVGSNTLNYMYVQASSGGNTSAIATQTVNVLTTLVADSPFTVTDFSVNSFNNGWTI